MCQFAMITITTKCIGFQTRLLLNVENEFVLNPQDSEIDFLSDLISLYFAEFVEKNVREIFRIFKLCE